jgi:hypothetical protein
MEYTGVIQNCTFIQYIPNITPIDPFLPLPSTVQFNQFASIEHFIPFAYIESAVSYIVSEASTAYKAYIASVVSYIAPIALTAPTVLTAHKESMEKILPNLSISLITLIVLIVLLIITFIITDCYDERSDDERSYDERCDDERSDDERSDDERSYDEDTEFTEDDRDYTSSIIEESLIVNRDGDIVSDNKKYRGILVDIWKTMEKQDILDNTTFKFKSGNKRGVKGYNLCERINMSFQNKDSNFTLKEILRMVKLNNLAIYLSIKLETGEIVHIIE